MWALMMFDSSTKIPDGVLSVSLTHMGNYDECLRVGPVQTSAGDFRGKHCMVTVGPAIRAANRSSHHSGVLRGALGPMLSYLTIQIGVCVPSTCSPSDAAQFVQNLGTGFVGFALATELGCHVGNSRELQSTDWVVVAVLIIFAIIVAASTAFDLYEKRKEKRRSWMLAFSLVQNGPRLLSTHSPGDTLGCLHGIRFLSMAWVVLGHEYTMGQLFSLNFLEYQKDMLENWARVYVTNGTLSVDSFLVLSGLLVSYIFLKTVKKSQSFNLPLFYLHRYIRLTPLFAIIILLTPTLFYYIGEGPLWDQNYEPIREACAKNWWSSILYVSNYVNPRSVCQAESWFLSVDMQLYWLSPLLLVPLWKWPKVGKQLTIIVFLLGIISAFVVSYVFEMFPTMSRQTDIDVIYTYLGQYYYATHTRFAPYIAGILLGAILSDMKSKGCKLQLSKLGVFLAWVGVAACLLLPLTLLQPFLESTYQYNILEASFYNSLHRPVWALGVCGLIFLCVHGYGGIIDTFLSWKFFIPLSRLSYSVYLLHGMVLAMHFYSIRSLQYSADVQLIPGFLETLVVSVLVAVIFSIMFEFPFMVLEKELLGNLFKNRPSPLIAEKRQREVNPSKEEGNAPEVVSS